VSRIRELLISGDLTGAGQIVMDNLAAKPTSPRAYHPLVNMGLDFGHSSSQVSSYTRWLDTYQGTATVTYLAGGVNYTCVTDSLLTSFEQFPFNLDRGNQPRRRISESPV
jgi:hypothetical protein